jgi:hypothetical protein
MMSFQKAIIDHFPLHEWQVNTIPVLTVLGHGCIGMISTLRHEREAQLSLPATSQLLNNGRYEHKPVRPSVIEFDGGSIL